MGVTFDRGGWLPRFRRVNDLDLTRCWVGWQRRVGLAAWERNEDLPLASLGYPLNAMHQQYRPTYTPIPWVRVPGTRWCLATYRRRRK